MSAKKSKSKKGPAKVETYRVLPLFHQSQEMLNLIGLLLSKPAAKAFQKDPTPGHWRRLMEIELESLLSQAMDAGDLSQVELEALAQRWLRPAAAVQVSTPTELAWAVFNGGMEINLESPYALVMEYLEARLEGDAEYIERLLQKSQRLAPATEVSIKAYLRISPLERVEMLLSNLALDAPEIAA